MSHRTLLAAAALTAALAPAAPAHAAPGKLSFSGTAVFPTYPCAISCHGAFTSDIAAVGYDLDGGPITRVTMVFDFNNTCTAGEPVTTTIDGTMTVWHGGLADPGRQVRVTVVGTDATYTGDFVGKGTVVPSPLPSCAAPSAVAATMTGSGVLVV